MRTAVVRLSADNRRNIGLSVGDTVNVLHLGDDVTFWDAGAEVTRIVTRRGRRKGLHDIHLRQLPASPACSPTKGTA